MNQPQMTAGETTQDTRAVIVTGSGSTGNIGHAVALQFAREGRRPVLIDLNQAGLADVAADIEGKTGIAPLSFVGDVTDEDFAASTVADLLQQEFEIAGLAAMAGLTADGLLSRMTRDQFMQPIRVHIWGTMVWVREIANRCWNPTYKNIGDTSDCGWFVIGASSIVAVAGNFGQTNYAASKAGLEAMLFALAEEFARMGVRVNLVAPGLVDTGMAAAIPEAATKAFTDRTLAGRLINPVEVARVVTFLASDAASGINQAVIPINGGQRLLVMPE